MPIIGLEANFHSKTERHWLFESPVHFLSAKLKLNGEREYCSYSSPRTPEPRTIEGPLETFS